MGGLLRIITEMQKTTTVLWFLIKSSWQRLLVNADWRARGLCPPISVIFNADWTNLAYAVKSATTNNGCHDDFRKNSTSRRYI